MSIHKKIIILSIMIYISIIAIEQVFSTNQTNKNSPDKLAEIVRRAKSYSGKKYLYGGTGKSGFDCSGFVLKVYNEAGISIPRMSKNQYINGKKIPLESARPGDLLFFKIENNKISHVAIFLGKGKFIHSPSRGKSVSIASLDNPYWKRKFFSAVTYIIK